MTPLPAAMGGGDGLVVWRLDQRRPIDLLATSAGTQIVEDFLQRLEYGVYA